jgi:hypothetical protein
MKLKGKLGVVILGLGFLVASACIAHAMDPQTVQSANGGIFYDSRHLNVVPVVSYTEQGGTTASRADGAKQVSPYHTYGADQFGDNLPRAKNLPAREADSQPRRWTPETYGLMGDYGRDSR